MKTVAWGFVPVLALMAGWAVAAQAKGLTLTYDMGGVPLTILEDEAGTVQIDGLSYPGLVLYVPATQTVYYQPPDEPEWLAIPPTATEGYGLPATLVAGAAWQPYLNSPTQRWQVKAAQMDCDNWFASQKAGQVTGLTAADLLRVLTTLQWLHAGHAAAPCEKLVLGDAEGKKVGLPLYFTALSVRWQLTELAQGDVPTITLPANPVPVDDAARLRILLAQFGPEDREQILTEVERLPLNQQLERIEKMLSDQAAY